MKNIAVIPAFNEGPRIAETIRGVLPYVQTVIVVDDGSHDQTAQEAQRAGAMLIRHFINRNQGAALRTGTEAALRMGADVIVHIDADGQHDPVFLPSILQPIQTGTADVVFGSRFLGIDAEGMPPFRRVVLWAGKMFNVYALGIPYHVTDPQSGFRAFTAQAATQMPFYHDGRAHASEILRTVTRSPLRWQEVPVRVRYTSDTLAKGMKAWNAFEIAWHLFLGKFHQDM